MRLMGISEEYVMPRIYVMILGVFLGWGLVIAAGWILWDLLS